LIRCRHVSILFSSYVFRFAGASAAADYCRLPVILHAVCRHQRSFSSASLIVELRVFMLFSLMLFSLRHFAAASRATF